MIINATFSRTVRKPHCKKRIECKNVPGIKVENGLKWSDPFDYVRIRNEIMLHKPKGKGWVLTGYCCVAD